MGNGKVSRANAILQGQSEKGIDRELALELLYMLPDAFIHEYEILYHRVWGRIKMGEVGGYGGRPRGHGDGPHGDRPNEWMGSRSEDRISGSSSQMDNDQDGSGRKGQRIKDRPSSSIGFGIKDQRAFRIKKRIDRKLRELSREIREGNSGNENKNKISCAACGRFCSPEWQFCPWCGFDKERKGTKGGGGTGTVVS